MLAGMVAGFLEAVYNGPKVGCLRSGCRNAIRTGDVYLVDTWSQNPRPLCAACGQTDRYRRKKALERGDIQAPEQNPAGTGEETSLDD